MFSNDANKCDGESRKINITALLSISLSFKWQTHSSHAPCCRLTGMWTVWEEACVIPVCVTVFSRGASGKKGTPERKQRSRWDWPLLSQIGWTPFWPQGTKRLEKIIAAAHRISFCCPNEKPLCQQAARPQCQQNSQFGRWDGGAELFRTTKTL